MVNVLVVTDSTSDLTAKVARELGITVVPLNIHFGEEVFLDGPTMDVDSFWKHLGRSSHHPKTSQPSPAAFAEVYQQAAAEGRPVVSIHISTKLSGTLQSAQIAKGMVTDADVRIVDTASVTLGLGMVAMEAARMAAAGATADAIVARAEAMSQRIHIFFGLETLEFLQRGGRIGKAQALLGGLLGIKPILAIRDGEVHPADKVRGKSKVLPRVMELVAQKVAPGRKVRLAAVHTQNQEGAEAWLAAFKERYQLLEGISGAIGPVVAAHAGPGMVGVAIIDES